jgi:transcriptional antiterminator NusG
MEESKTVKWYLVHTYSGSEKKVKNSLEDHIKAYGFEDKIFEVILPVDYYSVVEKGKRKIKPLKVFPGYIVVKMILTDETWLVVKNIPGVLGFVGSGGKPTPLTENEIKTIRTRIGEEEAEEKLNFDIGDKVKILAGPFKEMEGTVEEINREKGKAKVILQMFGREMPVEIKTDFIQRV